MKMYLYRQGKVINQTHKKILQSILIVFSISAVCAGFSGPTASSDEGGRGSSTDSPVVSTILIEIKDFAGDARETAEMARSLIFLQEGEIFSATSLQESIDALKLSNRFQRIDVESTGEKGEITVIFRLIPFQLIKDIRFSGQFPLFEREILNAMTIYPGDVFVEEEFKKQGALLEDLLKREGFPFPKIDVTAHEDPKDGFIVVRVHMEKGPYYTLKRFEINGNRAFSNMKLKLKTHTWRASLLPGSSGRFTEKNLKKDIRKLTEYYWSKAYPDARINFKIQEGEEEKTVFVVLTIHEGPRYDIEFVANEEFWDLTLRKDLILFQKGNKNKLGLKKSVRKIKERYRMAGYLQTQVKPEEGETKTDNEEMIRPFRLLIDEKPRSIVDSIDIVGNTVFDDDKIHKQMLIEVRGAFIQETFQGDLNAIKSLYFRDGYIDAKVTENLIWTDDMGSVTINITIEEGVQTHVSSMEVRGVTALSGEKVRSAIKLKQGEPFRKYMIRSDENALSALISEEGYPHVTVKGEFSLSKDGSQAAIVYNVDEGPQVIIGRIYYNGNLRTKEKVLQNELEIEAGEPFSLVNMVQGQRNIRNLDIFNSVRFKTIGLKEEREEVNLFVEVEERKPYYVEAGGGYESEKGFYVHGGTGDHNLFGTHKDVWLEGELSQIGHMAETGIKEPRLLGSRISAAFSLFTEWREEFNQDFGTVTHGSSLGFERKLFQHITTGLNFSLELRDQFSSGTDSPEEERIKDETDEFEPRTILVTTPSINYDTRDSFIRPKKGIFSSFSVDISQGISDSLDNFLKYRFDVRTYVSPFSRLTFAFLGRAGFIDPYGPEERVPEDQLFFLGGTLDVRGFDENLLRFDSNGDPLGGRAAAAGSIEARIDIGHNFELAAFYDTGRVSDTLEDMGPKGFRSSVGGGLRYITPIGPIGLLYGVKLDREEGEDPGRLHFSLGYTF